ncbi:hypothetical protein A9Q84_11670 [Halobacteriovorax marinus]|uniref:Fatty acid hydroxylase domain-containing protein n=1 Tax=Halobacteriovorax marinus TaxID=97084 RepID=A0A1Y5F7S2_9BACT|nr:hypothetical protein A9Q84_11670 [Halobacteriovorax marinus]
MENRALVFIIVFILFFILERVFPRYKEPLSGVDSRFRKATNLTLIALGNILVRIVLPMGGVGFAIFCHENSYGILNILTISDNVNMIFSVITLDFIIYWQHRLFHIVPFLWRIHRVHHVDIFLDTTSGLRFHPFEILLSMFIKFFFIFILGANPIGVLIFEVILNGMAIFNHSNLAIKSGFDRALQLLVVTPNFHVIHHSKKSQLHNTNYGFNLSIWDKLFDSFTSSEKYLQSDFEVGLDSHSKKESFNLIKILMLPFK